jgi:hypothetical protein
MSVYLEIARQLMRAGQNARVDKSSGSLEVVLEGRAVELWSNSAGLLFLVAGDDEVRLAIERLGARRGQIYAAEEALRIIAVNDPCVVREIHALKRELDVVSDFRKERA